MANAHPHLGGDGVAGRRPQRRDRELPSLQGAGCEAEGYDFASATDTEVIAHLDRQLPGQAAAGRATSAAGTYAPLIEAVQAALAQLHGTYGLAILFRDYPDVMIAARLGSPLVVGVGDGEHFVASDASPLAGRHRQDRLSWPTTRWPSSRPTRSA